MVEVRILRADEHFVTRKEDVVTRHSFSFGDHYDPTNVGFGRLVAANDITLVPGAGFDEHPHRGIDIVSWVVSGTLAHRDHNGNAATLVPAGSYQHVRAGSGIVHSERNDAYLLDSMLFPDKPLRFVQMWLTPMEIEPYGEPSYRTAEASHVDVDDARFTVLGLWTRAHAQIRATDRVWLLVLRGSADIEGVDGVERLEGAVSLNEGDELRLTYAADEPREPLVATATSADTQILVWNL